MYVGGIHEAAGAPAHAWADTWLEGARLAQASGAGQAAGVRGDQGRGRGAAPKATRCASCGRPIFSPAVLIGRAAFGPVCAKKAGLIEVKQRRLKLATDAPVRDTLTADLFEGVGCA